jgi:hypothetical protein
MCQICSLRKVYMMTTLTKNHILELICLNLIALVSILVPIMIYQLDPWGLGIIGVILAFVLWGLPGGNIGCIHLFVGGSLPFVISYPLCLLFILEEAQYPPLTREDCPHFNVDGDGKCNILVEPSECKEYCRTLNLIEAKP